MPKKSYVIWWQTVDGRNKVDVFVPVTDSRMTTSYLHRCENPRQSARDHVNLLTRNGLKVTQIISGSNVGILS